MTSYYNRIEKLPYIALVTTSLMALIGHCIPEQHPSAYLPQDITKPHGSLITPRCAIAIDDARVANKPVSDPECVPDAAVPQPQPVTPQPRAAPRNPLHEVNASAYSGR